MYSPLRTSTAIAAMALAATGLAVAPSPAAATTPAQWQPPIPLGPADPGSEGGVDIAVSADGSHALAGWWLNGNTTVAEWAGSAWSTPATISRAGHESDADPDVEISADGSRALVGWSGDVGEGLSPVFVASRAGAPWTRGRVLGYSEHHFGENSLALAENGSRALAAWAQMDPDEWTEQGLKVSWWDGSSWSTSTLRRRNPDAAPVVAISADGQVAMVMWARDGSVYASWWRGGQWSAPQSVITRPYDFVHIRSALSGDGSRAVATVGFKLDNDVDRGRLFGASYADGAWASTPLGPGWPGETVLDSDGSSGLFSWDYQPRPMDNPEPTLRGIGSWGYPNVWTTAELQPPTTYFALRGSPQLAMSADGSQSLSLWTNVPGLNADASVWASMKSGSAWGGPELLTTCSGTWNCPTAAAMAADGSMTFAMSAFAGQVYVSSVSPEPAPPSKVSQVKVKVKATSASRGKAKIRWQAAVNADYYQVKVSKPKAKKYHFHKRWHDVSGRKYVAKVKLDKKYKVKIRAVGPGGKGPTKKKVFHT